MATLVKYNGRVLGRYIGQEITIHCDGTIMQDNLEIVLDAEATVPILGQAVLGRAILGNTWPRLDAPTISLVDVILPKLTTPTICIEVRELNAPVIYIETEVIPKLGTPVIYIEAKKLDTPEIWLESNGVRWNKYNTVATEHYRYVQDDQFVGQEMNSYYDYWWTSPTYPTRYELSETDGFYVPSGTPMVNSENIVGAYLVYWNVVYQIIGIEPAPEADWSSNLYRISGTCVASATAELDFVTYSKGNTLIGTVEADEGEMPASGEKLDEGNGWYIIRTSDGIYYYEREDK